MNSPYPIIVGLLLFCTFVIGHSNQENDFGQYSAVIDKIIQRHYQKHVNSLELTSKEAFLVVSKEKNAEFVQNISRKCDHDEIVTPLNLKVTRNLDSILSKRGEKLEKIDLPKRQVAWESIRFNVDNTYYSNSDPRACYTIGAKVVLGEAGSTTPCNGDGDNDCLYTCTSNDILSPTLQTIFKDSILPAVLEIFEEILTIQRVQGNLLLDKNIWDGFDELCADGIPLSSSLVRTLGAGLPNSDMLVIGAARPCTSTGTVAYARACNFDWDGSSSLGVFGRPLAGHVNFCPRYFQQFENPFSPFDFNAAVKVGVHEFTHAMGFSSNFYRSYLSPTTGLPYVGGATSTSVKTGTNPSGNPVSATIASLNTPKLVAIAKQHYDCNSMTGVELENNGGAGTAGSHWEQRMVQNEYMAGYINPIMPVSYLTLSLFEDMGWYKADLTKSQYWAWGKDQGCPWVQNRCENSWTSQGYFCSDPNQSGCSADRLAKGYCNIVQYNGNLPAYYQHFTNPSLGGDDAASDYCTYNYYEDYCADVSITPSGSLGESYGPSSLCFPVGQYSNSINNLGCYRFVCTSPTSLLVTVGSETLACPEEGGPVKSKTLRGVVDCPPASLICTSIVNNINYNTTATVSSSSELSIFVVLIISIICIVF